MKPGGKTLFAVSIVVFAVDFVYLMAMSALSTFGKTGADPIHTFLVAAGFGLFIYASVRSYEWGALNPVQLIGRIVIMATAFLFLLGLVRLSSTPEFSIGGGSISASSPVTVLVSLLCGIGGGILSIRMFLALTELIFVKRRRVTKRNFVALLGVAGGFMLTDYLFNPMGLGKNETDWVATVFFLLLLVLMILNSFRFSWILVLTRREKLINLLLSSFGFVFFLILSIDAAIITHEPSDGGFLQQALMYYHPLVHSLVASVFLFACLYMGIGSASTLLHLPTAKEFDKKKLEISSLQNMSSLVTQVFDFDELVATTTHLAIEVSEGGAAWLELVSDENAASAIIPHSARNITPEEILSLHFGDGSPLQEIVVTSGKQVVVQDFANDRRVRVEATHHRFGSLVLLPLKSHDRVIGLLGITKQNPYEFDKDVLNVLNAFADMVAIALENSRLITESIQQERFNQELKVARQMQRSLLPTLLPIADTYEISATSIPAMEVGGDYYDVIQLDDDYIGLTIGDVSGKGVSAALYMAQVKGIFQTLTRNSRSTREILSSMNQTLSGSLDRKSFISLLYAVLNIRTGELTFARAGHCPLLYISDGSSQYLQPKGMGLGLDRTERFSQSIEEETIQLANGDLIVLYTDGVTEAKDEHGEEFHYQRLASLVERLKDSNTDDIMNTIIQTVRRYTNAREAEDDMTLLVLRWKGAVHESRRSTTIIEQSEYKGVTS